MSFIGVIGEEVRWFHADDVYDVGTISYIEQRLDGTVLVIVDFGDWLEQWDDGAVDFTLRPVFLEAREVLTPLHPGVVVRKYHS